MKKKKGTLNRDFSTTQIPPQMWENFLGTVLSGVLNHRKLDAIKINNDNFHCILGNALRHKSYYLIKKCEKFIEDRSGILIQFQDLRKISFIIYSGDNSLEFLENKIISPLIEIFKSYIGTSPETHSIELNITYQEKDLPYLKKFIETYGRIIHKISMVATDLINDKILIKITKHCENLKHLNLFSYHHLSKERISSIQNLLNIESLSFEDGTDVESLEVQDCKNVEILEIARAKDTKSIHIKNMTKVRRLEVVECSNLEYLSIIGCPHLEEIFIYDCPNLEYNPNLKENQKLKYCSVNNKKCI